MDKLQEQLKIEQEEKRQKELSEKNSPPPTTPIANTPLDDKTIANISDINSQISRLEAETKLELAKRNINSLKDWESEKKKQQDDLNKQGELLTDRESKLMEQEVEVSGQKSLLDEDVIKNQQWSDKLDRAEKGLKAEVSKFLVEKGKNKEILRVNFENLMKLLCNPLVQNEYGDGYTLDCVDNIISNSVKIVAVILETRCGVKPMYNESGEYLSVEARSKLGFKPNGEKFKES